MRSVKNPGPFLSPPKKLSFVKMTQNTANRVKVHNFSNVKNYFKKKHFSFLEL